METSQNNTNGSTVPFRTEAHTSPSLSLCRNRFGQRIDPSIEVSDARDVALKKEKLCKNFHLRGHCNCFVRRQRACNFQHRPVDEQELAALRIIARELPCHNGINCRDSSCYAGNRCPKSKICIRSCQFPLTRHLLNSEIVDTPQTGLSSISLPTNSKVLDGPNGPV